MVILRDFSGGGARDFSARGSVSDSEVMREVIIRPVRTSTAIVKIEEEETTRKLREVTNCAQVTERLARDITPKNSTP